MRFEFMNGPWENAERPTLVMENPTGGDPIILGEFASVYRPADLHELCALATTQSEGD